MKVTFINKSDATGGAAVVTMRLVRALRRIGVDAKMLVTERLTEEEYVATAATAYNIKRAFLMERLKLFIANGLHRDTLFKIDCGAYGLPLSSHPWVLEADVIVLNWVNQGVLSLREIARILSLGKPVVWTLHDLWTAMGVCHLPGNCKRYKYGCGLCPLLHSSTFKDLSSKVFELKKGIYQRFSFAAVAVSHRERDIAAASPLMEGHRIEVIPNGFPIPEAPIEESHSGNEGITIVMGAARLDDSVKGIEVLIRATQLLRQRHPDVAETLNLLTFGDIRNAALLNEIAIPHRHLGPISGEENVSAVYQQADILLSTSHYETFGATLVEGMVQGCIPVAFDNGGQSDIITHLQTGYLAPYSPDLDIAATNIVDGILWAVQQRGSIARNTLREKARSAFSDTSVAKRYHELFTNLLTS
jgi:glycosyltransferase involved in cell wall biosynthesis